MSCKQKGATEMLSELKDEIKSIAQQKEISPTVRHKLIDEAIKRKLNAIKT